MTRLDPRYAWVRQLAAFAVVLAVWEAAGRADMLNPLYVPSPSRVGAALVDLFSDGRIWPHLEATFSAALGGLALGIVVGVLLGVVAALVPFIAELLEPVMTVLNAIPRVILAPLFVIWLGIGLASKVALSFILVAVLIFFTVFTGIRQWTAGSSSASSRWAATAGRSCGTSICRRSPPGCSAISRSRSVLPSPALAWESSWPRRRASVIYSPLRRAPTTPR
jgi:ABC-type nitrate/sulfonate/bicarbonate transport system permease component